MVTSLIHKVACTLIAVALGIGITGAVLNTYNLRKLQTLSIRSQKGQENIDPGYSVKRVAVFEDDLAYRGLRGIYEIIDKKNNRKYLGVGGVGITDVGLFQSTRVREVFER